MSSSSSESNKRSINSGTQKQKQKQGKKAVDLKGPCTSGISPILLQFDELYGKKEDCDDAQQLVASAEIDPNNGDHRPYFRAVWPRLLPFQREGVAFAVLKEGRCAIADEMGLGKTVQAIASMAYFQTDWPLLIVCPASVRGAWSVELEKWIPMLPTRGIAVVRGRADIEAFRPGAKIIIMTYSLFTHGSAAAEAAKKLSPPCVVLDESHYIKQPKSQRTMLISTIAKASRRLILLSGTPALARPCELHPQVSALRPDLFKSYSAFTARFCDAKRNRFGVWDVSGASNLEELNGILSEVMIRRLKKEVLTQLPAKRRSRVVIELHPSAQTKMRKLAAELQASRDRCNENVADSKSLAREAEWDHRRLLSESYKATGEAKLKGVCEYVTQLLECTDTSCMGGSGNDGSSGEDGLITSNKVLLFAHHLSVLDGLQACCVKAKVGFVRIDGSVPAQERQRLVDEFQRVPAIRVAVLSLTAAGQGITLTAASTVVFAELHWTPGVIVQAEDRAHRIGQRNAVNVIYLVAQGKDGIDQIIWGTIGRKVDIVGKALDGRESRMDAMLVKRSSELSSSSSSETVDGEMAEMVKWFAGEGLPPLPVAPSEPKPARGDMRHFFKPVAKGSQPLPTSAASLSQHAKRLRTNAADTTTSLDYEEKQAKKERRIKGTAPPQHQIFGQPLERRCKDITCIKSVPPQQLDLNCVESIVDLTDTANESDEDTNESGISKVTINEDEPDISFDAELHALREGWDCEVCTLHNEPSKGWFLFKHSPPKPRCAACGTIPSKISVLSRSAITSPRSICTSSTPISSTPVLPSSASSSSSSVTSMKSCAMRSQETAHENFGKHLLSAESRYSFEVVHFSVSSNTGRISLLSPRLSHDQSNTTSGNKHSLRDESCPIGVNFLIETVQKSGLLAEAGSTTGFLSTTSAEKDGTMMEGEDSRKRKRQEQVPFENDEILEEAFGGVEAVAVLRKYLASRVGELRHLCRTSQSATISTVSSTSPVIENESAGKCAVDPKQPFNEQAARHLMPRFELVVGSSSSEESDLGSDSDSDSVGMQTAFDIRSISNVQLEKYAMRLLVDEVRVFIEEWEGKKSEPTNAGLRPYERSLLCDRVLRPPRLAPLLPLALQEAALRTSSSSASSSSSLCFMRYPDQSNTIALNECRWCRGPIAPATFTPSSFVSSSGVQYSYCRWECAQEAALRSGSSTAIRRQLFALEHGKCSLCGFDAHSFWLRIQNLTPAERLQEFLKLNAQAAEPDSEAGSNPGLRFNPTPRLLKQPREDDFWQADHTLAVAEGGGACGLENLRTLCTPCHRKETSALRRRLKERANAEAAGSTADIRNWFGAGPSTYHHAATKEAVSGSVFHAQHVSFSDD